MPVIYAAAGNCHVYVDATADLAMAERIIVNAKVQRPGVCNAAETLLVHSSVAGVVPAGRDGGAALARRRAARRRARAGDRSVGGVGLRVRLGRGVPRADPGRAGRGLRTRRRSTTSTRYGSGHSEAIVTNDRAAARAFQLGIDSACIYVNASTRFTDGGEFGMGAEIGNSTQKLHARGPIGLRELCSTRYLVDGDGQIRGLKLGLLGGTFNPPHLGHLVCAQEALRAARARRVSCSCRSTRRRTRRSSSDPGVEHRVELCRLAVAGDPRFAVSRLEADVAGSVLHGRYPQTAA